MAYRVAGSLSGLTLVVAEESDRRLVLVSDRRDWLPAWVVALFFGGLYLWFASIPLRRGAVELDRLFGCWALFWAGPLLALPFYLFTRSWYLRLEILRGGGIHKYRVPRMGGPMLTFRVTPLILGRVLAVRVAETTQNEDGCSRIRYWKIAAETIDGRVEPLCAWWLREEKSAGSTPTATRGCAFGALVALAEKFAAGVAAGVEEGKHIAALRGDLGSEKRAAALETERQEFERQLVVLRHYFGDKLVVEWGEDERLPT